MVAFPRFGRLAFGEPQVAPDKQSKLANIGLVSDSMLEGNPEYRDRLNMYTAAVSAALSGDPKLVAALDKTLEVELLSRQTRNRVQEDQAAAIDALAQLGALGKQKEVEAAAAARNTNSNVQNGGANDAEGAQITPSDDNNFIKRAKKAVIAAHQNNKNSNNKIDPSNTKARAELEKLALDPNFSGEYTTATLTDRVVFVATTFVLRGITLSLVDWGIATQFVNDLQAAMGMYVGLYLTLFALWALIVNGFKKDVLMSSLFMYISSRDPKFVARIAAHVALQVLLLPVPALLLSRAKDLQSAATYRERRAISAALSNVTLLMWLGTSFVAMRM